MLFRSGTEKVFAIPVDADADFVPANLTQGSFVLDFYTLPSGDLLVHTSSIISSTDYYVLHTLKALNRILLLVGVDTQRDWLPEARRFRRSADRSIGTSANGQKAVAGAGGTVEAHFRSRQCRVCQDREFAKKNADMGICDTCLQHPSVVVNHLIVRQHAAERRSHDLMKICASCARMPASEAHQCDSLDCPIMYDRVRVVRDVEDAATFTHALNKLR